MRSCVFFNPQLLTRAPPKTTIFPLQQILQTPPLAPAAAIRCVTDRGTLEQSTVLQDEGRLIFRVGSGLDRADIIAIGCPQFRSIVNGPVSIIIDPSDARLPVASGAHQNHCPRIKPLKLNPRDTKFPERRGQEPIAEARTLQERPDQ